MSSSRASSTFTPLCNHNHHPFSQTFFTLWNWNSLPLIVISHFPRPKDDHSIFCLHDFDYPGYLLKSVIKLYLFFCAWLPPSSIMSSAHSLCHGSGFPSLLRLTPIPFDVRTALRFLCSSAWTAWTWLASRLSPVLNSAAVNVGVQIPVPGLVFSSLGLELNVELLDYRRVLFFIFWEPSILFSTIAEPVCICANSGRGFQFLFAKTCYFLLLLFFSF